MTSDFKNAPTRAGREISHTGTMLFGRFKRNYANLLSGAGDWVHVRGVTYSLHRAGFHLQSKTQVRTAQSFLPPAGSLGRAPGRVAHKVFPNEAGRPCRDGKGTSRHTDGNNTVHGGFDLLQGCQTRIVGDRPSFQQPVFYLFDRAEFLHVPIRRHDEGKGLPPANFNQPYIFLERRTGYADRISSALRKAGPAPSRSRFLLLRLNVRRERDL